MAGPSIATAVDGFNDDGFAVLPAYLEEDDLRAAVDALPVLFPTADEFHDAVDPRRAARFRDEFAGIDPFPFAANALSLLAVNERLIDLAAALLRTDDLRAFSLEAWAKYTGAADYDQPHHRDYLSHTVAVPAPSSPPTHVEMFVYLVDVPSELGPPSYVPLRFTQHLPVLPNWYPREDAQPDAQHPTWTATTGTLYLYDVEVSAAGPAGTVVAYRNETFHRATELTAPRGARYTIHAGFRRADADWITRRAWTDSARNADWYEFVASASARQLRLFGFPPPGHPYWTPETVAGLALRYPGIDASMFSA